MLVQNMMTFITVVYGDNQQRIFNPQCTTLHLLECIRKYCYTNDNINAILDLTDSLGNIKHLPDHLNSYANIYLDGRETYWLVKVEKGPTDEDQKRYSLLINNSEKHYPDLASKLEEISRSPSRQTPSSARKGESGWANVRKKLPKTGKGSSKRANVSKKR